MAVLSKEKLDPVLFPLLQEIIALQGRIKELEEELAPWRESAKPLVIAGGDRYKKNGIQARITRTDKFITQALRLLEDEGELIYPLLTITSSEMKGAVGAGGILKGRLDELVERGIVVVEPQTPRLIVEKI